MTCTICHHPRREEIERACLLRDFGDTDVSLRDIAKEFDVDYRDLQVHVLMHIPLEAVVDDCKENVDEKTSIAGRLKLREADILRKVMDDTYVTFKNLSTKINNIVGMHTADSPTLGQITKPITDLYLGTSQSIRDTAEKLMKLDIMENGEKDAGLTQVAALVDALHGSNRS